jgi:hypothetical protein
MITRTPTTDRTRSSLAAWLDASVVIVALIALSVFVFGGFRENVAGLRLSVRSGDRLLVLALLLTVVRHILMPRPTIATTVAQAASRVWSSDIFQAAWAPFAATRAVVLLTGILAVVTIGIVPGTERFRVSDNMLENLLARWDAQWYLSIVQEGYQWNGDPWQEQNVVFFPAFPLAMRVFGMVLGRQWLLAGLLLALAAFLGALTYIYRLATQLMTVERARAAVWLVASYPFAVYYGAVYTESFYLLGAVGTFFHLSRAEWWRAAGWGFFLALCRPNGFFIALPAAMFVAQHVWRERRVSVSALMACVAPALGALTYSAYLFARFGDGFVWMKGQQAWGRVFVGIWPSLVALFGDRFTVIAEQGFTYYLSTNPYDFIYTCTAIFVLASLWPCTRRFGLPYAVFVAINILPPLLMGGMMSIGRMTSVLFPAFLWLAVALPERQLWVWIVASSVLQGLVAALFFTWRPVF